MATKTKIRAAATEELLSTSVNPEGSFSGRRRGVACVMSSFFGGEDGGDMVVVMFFHSWN